MEGVVSCARTKHYEYAIKLIATKATHRILKVTL